MRSSLSHWGPQYFILLRIHALCHVDLKLLSPKGQSLFLNPWIPHGIVACFGQYNTEERWAILGLSLKKPCMFLFTFITETKSSGQDERHTELSHSSHSILDQPTVWCTREPSQDQQSHQPGPDSSIIALRQCVGFCHISTWISHRSMCVSSLLNLLPTSNSIPPL